jgi:uncharacterized protein
VRVDLAAGRERLEAALEEPRRVRRAAVVMHGGGSSMRSAMVRGIAHELVRREIAVLRFNFRGVGRSSGRFYADDGVGERADARGAIALMAARYPGVPLWLAGESFGAWAGFEPGLSDRRVRALLAVALPVPSERFDPSYLRRKRSRPFALVAGSRDEYAPLDELEAFVDALPDPKRLFLVDGASHGFERKRTAALAAVAKAIRWLAGQESSQRLDG